jgi:type IV pilus assembly protein PilA
MMEKEKEAMRKEKINDKGFSLVELIIVIAIMALLVVVLAPQYLKYVERARNAMDLQNATTIVNAIQIYAADPQADPPITAVDTNGQKITINAEGTASEVSSNNATLIAALKNAGIDINNMHCVSKTAWTSYEITVNVSADGNVSFAYQSSGGAAAEAFADMMAGAGNNDGVEENP